MLLWQFKFTFEIIFVTLKKNLSCTGWRPNKLHFIKTAGLNEISMKSLIVLDTTQIVI